MRRKKARTVNEKIGIRTKDERSRILTRGAFYSGELKGLVADLGNGVFVVTKDAAKELINLGVDYEPVEIVKGVPTSVREFIRDQCREKGIAAPF